MNGIELSYQFFMKNQDFPLVCNGSLMFKALSNAFFRKILFVFSSFPNFSSYNFAKKWYYCNETNLKEE